MAALIWSRSAWSSALSGAGPTAASFTPSGGIHVIGDPCHLLGQVEASRLFGHPAQAGVRTFGSNNASCTRTSATAGDFLRLYVLYADGAAKDSSVYTTVKSSDAQPVPGLGDDAYFKKAFYLLRVAKGHWLFDVSAALGGTNPGLDQLTSLAQVVLMRLPN